MRFAPELPMRAPDEPRPPGVAAMRVVGLATAAATVVGSALTEPGAGLSGRGGLVSLSIAAFAAGVVVGAPRRDLGPGRRFAALLVLVAGTLGLILLQGDSSSALTGIYIATIFAALRLPNRQALIVAGLAVVGGALAYGVAADDPGGAVLTVVLGVPPWFVVMRALRAQRARQMDTDALVEELRASRAAEAAAAAEAERARVARDMHDVLAHSLSALAIQLELARVQARAGAPELEATVADAHGRAIEGLAEARRAIGALRGDDPPGPERLPALVADWSAQGAVRASFKQTGTARPVPAEAGAALYRAAQEALTNVRRHADADEVEIELTWEPAAVALTVSDRAAMAVGSSRRGGRGAARLSEQNGAGPSPDGRTRDGHAAKASGDRGASGGAGASGGSGESGGGAAGGGHGLVGMRERAELLGGRLEAGTTPDGFRVRLELPA